MRAGIVVNVTRADRLRLEAIVADRSAPQKHVWRANVILATADGCGTTRTLSSEKMADITAQMISFAGTPVTFGVFQDPESFALLDQLSRLLVSANWIEQEWKSGGDIVMTRG